MKLSILGSTGSIGKQSLDVAKRLNIEIVAITANKSVAEMEQQIREFKPKIAVLCDPNAAAELKVKVADTFTKVLSGDSSLIEAAELNMADTVLNSLVGIKGLVPTVAAINAGKTIALANKETLVAGGEFVMKLARQKGVSILPVDSEHSAIFQCMQAKDKNQLKRIILTASGGPFFGIDKEKLKNVTAAQALKHPNWEMGAKITIDSATMMNKGLEVIEAVHLFDLPESKIDVVVHRESIIHSMIEFEDNSVLAQLSNADMRIPIQYALTYPARVQSPVSQLDLTEISTLSFFKPDNNTFGCLDICRRAIAKGGLVPAAVNGANEQAVKLFLEGKIKFCDIEEIALNALSSQKTVEYSTVEQVLEADLTAREAVLSQY